MKPRSVVAMLPGARIVPIADVAAALARNHRLQFRRDSRAGTLELTWPENPGKSLRRDDRFNLRRVRLLPYLSRA